MYLHSALIYFIELHYLHILYCSDCRVHVILSLMNKTVLVLAQNLLRKIPIIQEFTGTGNTIT